MGLVVNWRQIHPITDFIQDYISPICINSENHPSPHTLVKLPHNY